MVAVVSGSGLGLFNSSASSLGGAGANGNPVVGRGRDRVYVNSSTGNLIVQSVDETLAALGLDFAGVRTYNSQGLADEDNNDQWRLGVQQRIYKLTGTVNTSGSTVTKVFGDGAEVLYTWNTTRSRYESGDGDGANDFLTWNNTTSRWTWTDGSARTQEEYGLIDGIQRIRVSRDADGNSIAYNYDDPVNLKLLTSVSMAGATAQSVFFDYTGTNLSAIRVVSNGVTQTLTRYGYDTSNRLQTVTVDLSPGDNSVADNDTYTTTYGYDGASTRVASITQKDGSSVGFQYQLINGEYRLWTVTDAENRVTTFTYNTVAGTAVTSTAVNAAQLTSGSTVNVPPLAGALTASPAGWNGAALRESSGSAINDPRIAFDSNGNGFLIWRSGNNVVAQRYTRALNSWGPETVLDSRTNTTSAQSLAVDAGGNAIAAWVQSDGTANSVYAARYDIANGSWGPAAQVDLAPTDPTFPANTGGYSLITAINGARAAIAWQHNQATTGSVYDLWVARYDGATLSAPVRVETQTANASQQSIAIDSLGNVAVAFQQSDGTNTNIYVNRFNVGTGTWSEPVLRDTVTGVASDPRIAFDANGNGLLIYRHGNNVNAQRYTRSTDSWGTQVTLDTRTTTTTTPVLALDSGGTGFAAWVQSDGTANSVYAARFNGTTWDAATLIDTAPTDATFPVNTAAYSLQISVSGTRAAVIWQHNQATSGSVYDLYVARYNGTSWQAPESVESRSETAGQVNVATDSLGNVSAAFMQSDGTANSAWVNRYNVSAAGSYYVVPSGATWQSIANAVYGSNTAAAGIELQARMAPQTLATRVQLGGFPATLTVPAPGGTSYYQVVSGDTWSIVTNKLYGTTDANAIAALQAYCGTTTLALSGRLYVPATLKYQAVGTTATVYQATSVLNSLNVPTSYEQDTQGRVTRMLVAGIDTRFGYDPATGNVSTITRDPAGLNRITTFTYDSVTGLLQWTRDSLGNSTQRTYNSNNQLLTEIAYTVPDPDAINTGASPSGAMTTRYAYDSENHLRFVISADGRVTEHQYNAAGQRVLTFNHLAAAYGAASPFTETDLQNWVAGTGAGVRERIDYRYDWRGNIDRITRWETTLANGDGTGVSSLTQFVYDQRGLLLQKIEPRGSGTAPVVNAPNENQAFSTTYLYDGLGRIERAVDWLDGAEIAAGRALRTRVYTTAYDDVNRSTTVQLVGGLSVLSVHNRAGELIRAESGGITTTKYAYDAGGNLRITTDSTGVRQFSFYDSANRLVGTVDGDGTVTELIYDNANQLIKTVRHSTLLSGTTLATLVSGENPTAVTFDSLLIEVGTSDATDRVARRVYDNAGRLVYSVDEIGAVTKFTYDGANRLVEELRYRNTVSIARVTNQVLPAEITVAEHTDDRRTRHFYDNSGNLVATLDGEGYLTENTYDNAGHLITRFERANPVAAALRVTGTLDQLKASAGTDTETVADPEVDITTQYYYDMQGRLVGELDGESYFTRTNYDVAGNVSSTIRYRNKTDLTGRPALSAVHTAVAAMPSHTHARQYDGAGRLLSEVNFESTRTEYEYDNLDNVLSVRSAAGTTDERWSTARYDNFGRVFRELSGEGRAALDLLGGGATQTQIDAVWNRYGVLYAYDTAGRRTTATIQPNALQTLVTRYYYDNDDRLRFEVNHLGERKEYRYDAFGQLISEIKYFNAISTSGLNGGLLTSTLLTTLTSGADTTRDARINHTYTLRGQHDSSSTMELATTATAYNTFGEAQSETIGTGFSPTSFTYTRRGQLDETRRNGVLFEKREYDAFGRLAKVTDGRGKISRIEYDRVGRAIATIDALAGRSSVDYDGYSRVTQTDDATAGTNLTIYSYDDAALTTTVDTPAGVRVITTRTRHGETANVKIATTANPTAILDQKVFTYDKNGNLRFSIDDGTTVEERTYDSGGRLETTIDARGTITRIEYDAASRVYREIVDSAAGGLQLTTTHLYDRQGRLTDVTDARGTLTRTSYDRDGRVTEVAIDPTGLNLRTRYAYDTRNNTTLVTEGYGTSLPRRTKYIYDTLGRRTEEIIDPTSEGGTLNLRTQYKYDNNDNMTRKIDSRGFSCWYVYDDKNRLTHKIDALGGVTFMTYDEADRVASTRHYVIALSGANMTTLATQDSPTTAHFTLPPNSANDRFERTFYDKDGREIYNIDGLGVVTQREYDPMGNVTRLRVLSGPRLTGTYADTAAVTTALNGAANTLAVADRVTWNVYDARGRVEYSIDSMNGSVGSVTSFWYDGNGNVLEMQKYAASRALNLATDITTMRNWRSANQSAANDQLTRFWYDKADRQRFVFNAEGALTETRYNDFNRTTTSVAYSQPQTAIAALGTSSTAEEVALARVANPTYDQTTTSWADAAGRNRLVRDAEGYVTQTRYNDQSGALETIQYAEKPSTAPNEGTALGTALGYIVTTTARDRRSMNWIDAAGRERFSVDGEGYAVETRYDDVTGARRVIRYAQPLPANSTLAITDTLATANGAIATALTDGDEQRTRTDYDEVGRVKSVVQAETSTDQITEYYGYDAAGNKTKFTNAHGGGLGSAAFTWDYTYDAGGNLLTETTPNVDVHSVTANGTEITVSNAASTRIVTRFEYDFLGNVTHKHEADGHAQQRTTRFEYDSLGRQVRTYFPVVPVYNPTAGDTDYGSGGVLNPNETTPTSLYTETWYDALGNAFRSRDVSGNYAYKTYDRMGRVVYDISARVQGVSASWNQNYVTLHAYDAFGNQTGLTRYANALATQPSISASSLRNSDISVTASTADRTITTAHDRRNLATSVTQASLANNFWRAANVSAGSTFTDAAVTSTTYNAFGEVVKTSRKVSLVASEDTYSYYDRRGYKTAEIDPLSYLTKYKYDASGDVVEQTEFARQITGTYDIRTYTDAPLTPYTLGIGAAGTEQGFDRTTLNTYNRLNRLVLSSQLNVEHAGYNGLLLETRFENVSTSYGYDALGNQIRVTDALNNTTYTYYDVLGRTIAVVAPGRVVETGSSVRPATRFFRDAHGNVVKQIEYKSDVTGTLVNNVLPTFNVDDLNDRVTKMQYDLQGRVIRTEDANLADRFASYGADGRLSKEWVTVHNLLGPGTLDDRHESLVTIYKYDAQGQVIETKAPVSLDSGQVIRNTKTVYNAFGEIVTKGTVDALNTNGTQEFFDYDVTGRIWRTNSGDGVTRIVLYDLAGQATVEFRSQTVDLRSFGSVDAFLAAYNSDTVMRTETVYSALGKAIERYTPTYRINNYGLPAVAPDIFVGIVSGSPVAGHAYVYWVGTDDATADETFYYRTGGGVWTAATVVTLPGGYLGVDVHALRNADYEYQIIYRRAYQTSSIAQSTGTFRVNISQTIGIGSITQGTLSDADAIGNLSIVSTAPSPMTAGAQSATWTSPAQGAPYQWIGANVLHGSFASVGLSSVRLIVQYYKRTQGHPTWGQGSFVTLNEVTPTYVNGTEVHHSLGNDASFALEGGVHSLYRVQIYTADGATLLRDSRPDLAPVGLVWTAPTDQSVTAVFRFKQTVNSTFSPDFTVARLGTQFALNVFPLLTQNTTYDYEVEYRRAGVAIAKRAGQMTSNGEVINHSYAGTVSSTATDGFNQGVGSPTISGLSMSWPPPSDNLDPTFEAAHGIVSTFEWGTSTAYGSTLGITRPGSGNWSVNLAEIPTPPVNTTYYYRTRYSIGGRVVAEQTGNFQISAPNTSTSVTVNNNGPQPAATPAVTSVAGSNGILTASWSFNPSSGSQTYMTPPFGGGPGQWIGASVVGIGWADTGISQTVRVQIDYIIRNHLQQAAGPATKWSGDLAGSPTGLTQPVVWQDGNGTPHTVTPFAGISSVTRVRVYAVVGGQLGPLIRDSQASGGTAGPPRLTWNAPDASLNLTARITVNGATTNLTPSGGVFTHSLGSLNGSFSYLIEYFRAGETPAIVAQSGTVTTDTVSCSVSNVSVINRNPSWVTVSHSGASLSWSQAATAAGDVSFRYRVVGSGTWLNDLSPPASTGPNFSITFPNSAAGVTQYEYEVRYIRSGESLPYVYSTGTATVQRTNNSSTGTFGSKLDSTWRMQQVPVDATLTGNVFRWNYPLAGGSSVTFRYRINGGTETPVTFSSGGPQFEVALAGLPEPSSTVTWWIEYRYPGQAPYAAASGSVAANHTTWTTPASSISISTQQNQYPTPIQIAQAMDLGNGYLGWTTTVLANTTATIRYRIDGGAWQTTSLGFEAYGAGLRRQFTAPGAYEYELEYVQSGQPTPYAKTSGTFGVSVADNAPSLMTRTVDAPRSESLFSGGPYIEITPTPVNASAPDQDLVARAIWSRVPNPMANEYIPIVSASPNAYVQTQLGSSTQPAQYTAVAGITVEYHFQLKWAVNANVDTDMLFEYRVAGSGSAWSTKTVYLLNSGQQLGVDIHSFANTTYEFRLSYTRTGAAAPYATASGTFTKTGTLNNPVTLDALPAIPVEDATPVMKQSLDRWGNVLQSQDLATQLTNYRYDQRNLLVKIVEPTITYLDTRITVAEAPLPSARPTSYNFYDKLGRVIATRDPHGNETRLVYDAAGQLTSKQSADSAAHVGGAFVYNAYNTFGNVVQVTDELGFRTRTKYDGRDQVTEVWREIVAGTMPGWSVLTPEATMQRHAYTYDEAGRRITEVNGENETLRYAYDLAGNLSLRLMPLGGLTKYTYDVHGKKATEIQVLDTAGDVHTRQDWQFDYFGRLQDHIGIRLMNSTDEAKWGNDLRADYGYTYNFVGQLTNQTSSNGLNIAYYYDRAGQVTLIVDSAAKRRTDYTYDSAGRRIRERVTVDNLVHQDTRVTYDSHGRIATAEDPNYRLSYSYDLAGNRTLIRADYVNQAAQRVSDSLYYTYDEMNRVVISQGLLDLASRNVVITRPAPTYGTQGYRLKYNARGDRVEMTQRGGKWTQVGDRWSQPFTNGSDVTEYYKYDGLGRLTKTEIDKAGGGRQTRMEYTLDREGRAKFEWTYSIIIVNAEPDGYLEVRKVDSTYDADGRLSQQINRKKKNTESDTAYKIETIVRMGTSTYADHYGNSALEWSAGYDKAGNLRGYDIERYTQGQQTIGNWHWITHAKFSFDLGESFLQRVESAESYGDENRPGNGSTTRYYNANEELVAAIDAEAPNKSRAYVNNQSGQVLTSYQGIVNPPPNANREYWDSAVAYATRASRSSTPRVQNHFYINDQSVGSVGALQQNPQQPWRGNFDVNYTPVSSEYPGTQPQFVVVISGDTLRSIATRVYGDGNLWYILADENALSSPDALLTEGMSLRVPNKIVALSNSGSVFKPYDPAAAIGDLTPTQPIPPAPGMSTCQVLGMFVIIVITVIVAYYTGLWIAPKLAFLGPMAGATAGAIGAAAGSVVGQGVGIMLGLQEKFDWKQVAMAAATSFVTAGLGGLPGADTLKDGAQYAGIFSKMAESAKFAPMVKFFGSVTRVFGDSFQPVVQAGLKAAAVGAITQRLMVAANLKDKFSWREVASQSVGAMVGTAAGMGLNEIAPKMPQVFKETITGFAGGVASAAVKGGKIDYVNIAVDAFGNAVGNSIVRSIEVERFNAARLDALREYNRSVFAANGGSPSALTSGPNTAADNALKAREQERLLSPEGLEAFEKYGKGVDPLATLQVLMAGTGKGKSLSLSSAQFGTGGDIRRLLSAFGIEPSAFGDGVPMTPDIGSSYSSDQMRSAHAQILSVLGQGPSPWDGTYLPTLFVADPSAFVKGNPNQTTANIFGAAVYAVGGYADGAQYRGILGLSGQADPAHRVFNISLAAAQGDAFASMRVAEDAAVVRLTRSVEDFTAYYNNRDKPWHGWMAAPDMYQAAQSAETLREMQMEKLFAGDRLAPAALRDSAQNSIYLRHALLALDVVSVLPVTRFAGVAVRGMSAAGRSFANLTAGSLEKMANLVGQPSASLLVREMRASARAASDLNRLNPVLEFDAAGNEVIYRTMSKEHAEIFRSSNRLTATSETGVSSTRAYAELYDGVTVRITVKKGTFEQLERIGRAANGPTRIMYPDMPGNVGPWMETNAVFKVESYLSAGQKTPVMNTLLGRGKALDIFNSNVLKQEIVRPFYIHPKPR